MEAKYKIGYIDEDIRQVKKYTRRLKDFGFEIIGYDFHQGMSLEELMSQVYKYHMLQHNMDTFGDYL